MSAESLLLWMSARVQGSWLQFRAAVEELHVEDSDEAAGASDEESVPERGLPLYHTLRLNLQRLGHAEFFAGAGGSEWRIAPPCLAVTAWKQSWLGVLAGARSAKLLARVTSAVAPLQVEVLHVPACPPQIRIYAAEVEMLRILAQRAGLFFQESASLALLSSIPRIDELAIRARAEIPFGSQWRTERFSASSLRWNEATVQDAGSAELGLFRFSRSYERTVLLCIKGRPVALPAQVAKYLVLKARRRWVLRYDCSTQCLSVPAICRPPFLVERALILCSGAPPRYEARTAHLGLLHYSDVPAPIARLTFALLCQEMR